MRSQNLIASLMLTFGVLASGCRFDDDDGSPGSPSSTIVPYEASSCALGNEPGTRAYPIRTLRIPTIPSPEAPLPAVGFNIDGLTSTEADLAGCDQADMPGGVDDAFANIVVALDDTLPEVFAFDDLGIVPIMQFIELEVVISDWNETATDPCVVVTLHGTMSGRAITPLVGRASLVSGGVSLVAFGADLPVTIRIEPENLGGLGGLCTVDCLGFDVDFTIEGLVARLRFSDDMTHLVVAEAPDNTNATMLGGHVRYTGDAPGAFTTVVTRLINAIDPDLWATVQNVFSQRLDLDSTPTLSACTTVGSGTSADAFSIAVLASSVAP